MIEGDWSYTGSSLQSQLLQLICTTHWDIISTVSRLLLTRCIAEVQEPRGKLLQKAAVHVRTGQLVLPPQTIATASPLLRGWVPRGKLSTQSQQLEGRQDLKVPEQLTHSYPMLPYSRGAALTENPYLRRIRRLQRVADTFIG